MPVSSKLPSERRVTPTHPNFLPSDVSLRLLFERAVWFPLQDRVVQSFKLKAFSSRGVAYRARFYFPVGKCNRFFDTFVVKR